MRTKVKTLEYKKKKKKKKIIYFTQPIT